MSRFNILGFQYFTNDNEVLAGGKINFYQSGTTTRKDTFSDVEQTIPNTNPVVLTADGRSPDIFFTGSAKAVLTDADGVVIETLDPVGSVDTDSFAPWEPEKTYDQYAVVTGSDGLFYVSLINGNFANDPTISASEWKLLTEYIGFESSDDGYLWSVDNSEPQKVRAIDPKTVGGLILLSTATANNVATIDFTGINADYDHYQVHIINARPSTDGAYLDMRTSENNGASFESGSNTYRYLVFGGPVLASFIRLETTGVGNDGSGEPGANINMSLMNFSNTSAHKMIMWDVGLVDSSNNYQRGIGFAGRLSNNAVNAIRFFFSTGSIASGIFKLYGIRKS
jgi:hypothetical protein